MTRILALFCILAGAQPGFSQSTGSLVGKVKQANGPVEFAHIIIEGAGKGATADDQGNFQIDNIPFGQYKIRVSAVGYQPYTQTISIQTDKKSILEIALSEDVSQLQEVVVTGTMREVSKMDSPIPIEVYTPRLFMKNPTPNIFEALSVVNGVQPQVNCNVCNTGDIHINGLEGPYTMILIDGMPIVSSLSTVYGLAGIPNSLVKRMEIVKGPASTLYGSEAVGGVINIITKEPSSVPTWKADIFATSVGEYNVDLSTSMKAGKATSLFGINYFNYTTLRDINHDNFTDVTLQNRASLFNKWSFERKSGKNFTLAGRYVYENRWGGELQWTNQHRGTDIYYGESIYTNRVELLGSYEVKEVPGMHVDFSFNDHRQDSYYGLVKYLAEQQITFGQVRWSRQVGNHVILSGIPLRHTRYDDNTPATESNHLKNSFLPGIFIQDEMKLASRLTSLAGFRFDQHPVHGPIYTPRLSFKFTPDKNTTLRLTGGSGYRVVNLFTEDHAALTGSRQVEVVSDLKPEKSWNGNFNAVKNILFGDGFITLDASVFYTFFTNKIVGDFITDPNKIFYNNLKGHAISKGITLNVDASFSNSLKLIGGITLMDVYQIQTVNSEKIKIPQLQAPHFSGTLTASYTVAKPKITFDLTGRVNGPMLLPVVPNDFRPSKSPWFALMNFQLTKTVNDRLEIYGGVKNFLNFVPKYPLLRPFDPFDKSVGVDNPNGYTFDTSYNYAPVQGAKGVIGLRWTLN